MKEGQASTFLCPHNTDTGWNREDFIQGTDTPIHPETDITYEMEVKTCSGTPPKIHDELVAHEVESDRCIFIVSSGIGP